MRNLNVLVLYIYEVFCIIKTSCKCHILKHPPQYKKKYIIIYVSNLQKIPCLDIVGFDMFEGLAISVFLFIVFILTKSCFCKYETIVTSFSKLHFPLQ